MEPTANTLPQCPSCDGAGLVDGALCSECGGRGTVKRLRAASAAIPPATTPATPAGITTGSAARPAAAAPNRDDAAARLLRTLVESAENGEHMLDALQLLSLAGAASAGVVTDSDDVIQALAERLLANARTRLGLAHASPEKRSKRSKRDEG